MSLITDKEIKEIINREENIDIDSLKVIQRYIYDVKGIDVGEIQRINNYISLELFKRAVNKSFNYYLLKFNKNKE